MLTCLAVALSVASACADVASNSYLRIELGAGGGVTGQWDIALRDLDAAVGLDADDDGQITWGELRVRQVAVEAYAFSRLSLGGGGRTCTLQPSDFLVDYHAGNAYAVIRFGADCAPVSGALTLKYRLLFDLDPTHRGLLTLVQPTGARSEVLSPDRADINIDLAPQSMIDEVGHFVRFGIDHILLGYDHLLFVSVLLITAAFRRIARSAWTPFDNLGRVLVETLKILTAFTFAHSITLTLAVLGVIDVPSRLVDPAVAMTIMLAAIDNIRPILPQICWSVAFTFGLIYGLAFASALGPMRLAPLDLFLALGSFNIGVEFGQLALALLLVPIVFVVRREDAYTRAVAPALSGVAFLLAGIWFIDRVFLLDLLSLNAAAPLNFR